MASIIIPGIEDYPFKIKSAFYTVGTDTLSVIIASGTGETISGNTINTINKITDTTFTITLVSASVTYTIYLKNDGNFDKSTDGTTAIGSVTIGTVSTNADKSVNIIVDKRPLVSGVGKDLMTHQADYTLQVPYAGVTTGTANTYAIATPAITALTTGMAVSVKFNLDSAGASTLNWNGKGAKGIKKANGTDATVLKATGIYTLRYDGTNFILQGEGASGNAIASDLLSGKTAGVDAGDIIGTMPNNGAINITPRVNNQGIAAGYTSGGTVYGDADLAAGNIKSGVDIFGVAGSYLPLGAATGTGTTTSGSRLVVSGLTFKPNRIFVWFTDDVCAWYDARISTTYSMYTAYQAGTYKPTTSATITITDTGFSIYIDDVSNCSVKWFATN